MSRIAQPSRVSLRTALIAGVLLLLCQLQPLAAQGPGGGRPASAGELRLGSKNLRVPESGLGVDLVVERTRGTSGRVSVVLSTADGTAHAGEDYSPVNQELVWEDGRGGSQSVRLEILDDAVPEGDETVLVSLGGVTGGASIHPGQGTGVVRIRDNDADVTPDDGCNECEGGVTELRLRYAGTAPASVVVTQRIRGQHVSIFEALLQPGDEFTVVGRDSNGTLGPFIKLSVDGEQNAAFHTSCSEEIGPGLVSGDFEVLDGKSREGGPLCPVEGGGDDGEPMDGCDECDGQVTELTLRYLGDEEAQVRITQRIRGDHVVIFDALVEPEDVFTLEGANDKGTLGPFIRIYVGGRQVTGIHTSCSEPIGPGLVRGDFEVVDGFSRNGGRLCPVSDDGGGGSGDACGDCDGQVTELTLRYLGDEAAQVRITQRIRGDHVVIFDQEVQPDQAFTIQGQDRRGVLGSFIRIYVDGERVAGIHTSCSEEIGPGLVSGDFEVLEGFSRNGGRLCAVAPADGGGLRLGPGLFWE